MTDKEIAKDIVIALIGRTGSPVNTAANAANAFATILAAVSSKNAVPPDIPATTKNNYNPLDDI